MNEKKIKKILLERGISFNAIKLQKTIGDVKKLNKEFQKQIEKLEK